MARVDCGQALSGPVQHGEVIFIGKARQGIIRMLDNTCGQQPPFAHQPERWHAPAGNQGMDQPGDKHGLACAREAGHTQPESWLAERAEIMPQIGRARLDLLPERPRGDGNFPVP